MKKISSYITEIVIVAIHWSSVSIMAFEHCQFLQLQVLYFFLNFLIIGSMKNNILKCGPLKVLYQKVLNKKTLAKCTDKIIIALII